MTLGMITVVILAVSAALCAVATVSWECPKVCVNLQTDVR